MHYTSILLASALALGASVPAAAEVIDEGEDHFVTRDMRVVSADPYETWAALIAPNTWWNDNHTWSADASNMYLSAQAGGCFCELLPERDDAPEGVRRGSARHMEVIQAAPPMVLRMRGGLGPLQSEPADGVLTVTLKPVDGGTRILWEYVVGGAMRFDVPTIAKAVDGVMSQQLAGLANLLGEVEDAQPVGGEEDADVGEAGDEADTVIEDIDPAEGLSEGASEETEDMSAADEESDEAEIDPEDQPQRIEPQRVLTLEEAIDRMAGQDDQ